jgi:SAM-dependent methyltransferase
MSDESIELLYKKHHKVGGRYRKSFIEQKRARLFALWIGKGKEVLDLGCRDCTLTRHFIDGNKVVGADIDSEALEFAQKEYGIEVHRINLNSALPFEEEGFDVVILAETLEHLPYPSITLAEIRRILRTNAILIGNVPLFYHLHNRWQILCGKNLDWDPTHLQYFSYDSIRELLKQFLTIEKLVPIKGERWAKYSMRLFARNVAFLCRKA